MSGGDQDVPVLFARVAEKDHNEGDGEVECKVEPEDGVDAPVHHVPFLSRNKDLHVLNQDRELDDEHCEAVENCRNLAVLRRPVRRFALETIERDIRRAAI